MQEYLYKVVENNGSDYGSVIHTKWLTLKEANELQDQLKELFPESNFWIEFHLDEKPQENEEGYYNENAVDGWEDIYPDRDGY